ncbi:MAG: ATP-dependent Clp protease proteolytic subunit [Clostridia bacterium]|nr:ATP-dependent Clp protease proteolytic subunit [Clostridia bacterium]
MENETNVTPETEKTAFDDIVKSGSIVAKNSRESIHCLSIIGQIEGHYLLGENQKATKYEHIIPLLAAIEESDEIDGLLVVLNTMGGDVEAGLAIAEMIASMRKPTASLVLGGGHSIGVPLAVSAKVSLIVPTATMTVHPVRMTGLVVGVPQTFRYFQHMQERILRFIADHSRADIDHLRELMMKPDEIATDVGSILDGREAVEAGIIHRIGGLSDALDALREQIAAGKTQKV